jgi:hypothetical protein
VTTMTLDLATVTGYALSTGQSGAISWREYVSDYGLVDMAFRDWLSGMLVENGVSDLVIEPPVLRGASSILLTGLYFSANGVAARHGVRRRDADSHTVRKHILGADKLREIKRAFGPDEKRPSKNVVRQRLKNAVIGWARSAGYSPTDDNEADALAMLAWAKEAA